MNRLLRAEPWSKDFASDHLTRLASTRKAHSISSALAVLAILLAICEVPAAVAQLNQNCTVSVLNRTVSVNPDGSWVLPNIPANFGQVKARATCIQNGVTTFGESDFFTVPANGAVNLPAITLGVTTPIPTSLAIGPSTPSLTTAGQTVQLTVTATYPDGSTNDVSSASAGANYTISNTAIATISADGLVTAVSSGTVVIQANNDGATNIVSIPVVLAGSSHGGIPDSWAIAHGLNPNDPLMPLEDPDRDGLTNLQEFQTGTDPNNPDTDGDGLNDGDEVNKYHTNPLLPDTDGDSIPDGVEVQTGTDPLDSKSYDLKKATASSTLAPPVFALTTSIANPVLSVQLSWKVLLIDGKTTLDLTADPRTSYSSSNLQVCNFGVQAGLIFAGAPGSCIIAITQNTLTVTVAGTVQNFTPIPLSYIAIPGFANNVKVNGNYAYVAAGSAGLQVVDVTDRANPKIVTSLATPGNANDLRILGNTIYLAAGPAGLVIIDVSNPLSPELVGSVVTPDVAWDVAVSGNLAYIAAGNSGLQIADISIPASPTIVGEASPTANCPTGTAKGVDVSGALVALAAGSGGLQTVDVTNPKSPQILGCVGMPSGNAAKVAINGSTAFVAPYPDSLEVVDVTTPNAPQIIGTTSLTLGGRLQDVAVARVSHETLSFGADVYFVNGVPIVDVTQPSDPVPQAILNFSQYRDDNGHGIAVDFAFVYMTGEEGTISDIGVNGDTRLYIGQYQPISDPFGIPPTASITVPTAGATFIERQTIPIQINASDDVAVAGVSLTANGQAVGSETTPPYQFNYSIPVGVSNVSFVATAIDFGGNTGASAPVVVNVIPDPGTTVVGTVTDASGSPVGGAAVSVPGGLATTTVGDGTFSISRVPSILGNITARATFTATDGTVYGGVSASTPPIVSGTTDVGNIVIIPVPTVTGLSRKSALAGTTVALQVTGTSFTDSTIFTFQPAQSPSIAVSVVSIASDGTSAMLTVSSGLATSGTFALVATNVAGSSSAVIIPVDRFTVVNPSSTADTDGDGYPDVIEATFGSDPLDPNSIPIFGSSGEADSTVFSVLDLSQPPGPKAIQETDASVFSVLNAAQPSGSASTEEADSVFSVLNSAHPIGSPETGEADSVIFSVLNTATTLSTQAFQSETDGTIFSVLNANGYPTVTIAEADSILFSVQNNDQSAVQPAVKRIRPPTPIDSDGDGYPDALEIALGSDPNDPNSIPEIHPPPEAESTVFSVSNAARSAFLIDKRDTRPSAFNNEHRDHQSQAAKGETHVLKTINLHKPTIVRKLFDAGHTSIKFLVDWRYRLR